MPGLHEVHLQQQVRAGEPDIRLESGVPAGDPRPLGGDRLERPEHPRDVGELGQRHRGRGVGSAAGVPAVPRHREQQLVPGQQLGVDALHRGLRQPRVLLAEHDVELVREHPLVGRTGLLVGDLDPQPGMAPREQGQRGGHEGEQHGLEGGDAQGAGHLGQRTAQLGLRRLELLQDPFGVRDQDPRLRGQPDAAPGRFEQPHAGLRLELAQLLRDRRGAV